MHVGILTAPLRTQPLSTLIPWAAGVGVKALEIDVTSGSNLDAASVSDEQLDELRGLLQQYDMRISSLACYQMVTGFPEERTTAAKQSISQAIKLAEKIGR